MSTVTVKKERFLKYGDREDLFEEMSFEQTPNDQRPYPEQKEQQAKSLQRLYKVDLISQLQFQQIQGCGKLKPDPQNNSVLVVTTKFVVICQSSEGKLIQREMVKKKNELVMP